MIIQSATFGTLRGNMPLNKLAIIRDPVFKEQFTFLLAVSAFRRRFSWAFRCPVSFLIADSTSASERTVNLRVRAVRPVVSGRLLVSIEDRKSVV